MPMTGRIAVALSSIALLLVLAGCGGGATQTTQVRVYFLRDGKVGPVAREVSAADPEAGARAALSRGPTAEERAIGLTTAVSGLANPLLERSRAGLAQLVYTLTQFPGSPRAFGHTRPDFEDLTPAILVESPLPFQTVHPPLRATGTANTFEATFQYELIGPDARIVAHNFVTATSGSGERGTFDFTVPFAIDGPGSGELVVYEISAADGSRIHVVEIPLRLVQ